MVFGLALVMALVLGVATMAFGANGDFFKVGRDNFASAVSTLTKGGAGPALRLEVGSGAPLAVNSSAKVAKLNADKVDGLDSSAFLRDGGQVVRWGPVTVPSGGQALFPFTFRDPFDIECECPRTGGSRIELAARGTASLPYSVALQSTQGTATLPNIDSFFLTLTEVPGTPSVGSAMGSVVSHGTDESFTYDLYQVRRTNASGSQECTFGGYVVKGRSG